MGKLFIQDDNGMLRSVLGDDGGQIIVRPDHDEKIIGFADVVEESVDDTNLAGGSLVKSGTATPAGMIHHVTMVSMIYVGTSPTYMYVYAAGLAGDIIVLQELSVVSGRWYYSVVDLYLKNPDGMRLYIKNSTAGDTTRFRYCGHSFKLP